MCQLCVANGGDTILNRIILSIQLQADAIGNADGTGIMSVKEGKPTVWKTELGAGLITNLGVCVSEIITDSSPAFGHVRYASPGVAVTKQNAHPFAGTRFVLAHNGRLHKKNDTVAYKGGASEDANLASDSLEFLKCLEEKAKKNPSSSFIDLFKSAMDEHKGKFAMLIYDKLHSRYYVVRGKTADLHVMYMYEEIDAKTKSPVGFVVNTKQESLKVAAPLITAAYQSVTGRELYAEKPAELEKETMYEVIGVNLIEVGKVTENAVVYSSASGTGYTGYVAPPSGGKPAINLTIPIWGAASRIKEFADAHFLTMSDIDAMFQLFLGVKLSMANQEHFDAFIKKVIPVASAPVTLRRRIGLIVGTGGRIYPYQYEKGNWAYPWMLNSSADMEKLIKQLEDVYATTGAG